MELLTPQGFGDYELLDCGNFLKYERFGAYRLIRPEPQALWAPQHSIDKWRKNAHAEFLPKSSSSGVWNKLKQMPEQWTISYTPVGGSREMVFRLGLTSFKHVGIFPEQAVNWDYIFSGMHAIQGGEKKFLNLFAYTGGASLAAAAAGADVTHVDSIRQVVTWANQNRELSGISDIRWVVEDALKFVKREVKRGKKYQGIILDPPAYGHGTDGEKWKLEDNLAEMMEAVLQLLDEKQHLLILNAYSLGLSSLVIENLLRDHAKKSPDAELQTGELFLETQHGIKLPLGVFGRLRAGVAI
jgi:23S rRNA (cytosine1962-C5)-methyltransferase